MSRKDNNLSWLIGQKSGKLTVVATLSAQEVLAQGISKHSHAMLKCVCDCGKVKYVIPYNFLYRNTSSCGSKGCRSWVARNKQNMPVALTPGQEDKMVIVEKLDPVWHCSTPEESCCRSAIAHICCCECDKKSTCSKACANNPAECGGGRRRK